jgi:hypothetical protein
MSPCFMAILQDNSLSVLFLGFEHLPGTKLRAWLDKIVRLDFYGAPLRVDAEERLERCVTLLEDNSLSVLFLGFEHLPGIIVEKRNATLQPLLGIDPAWLDKIVRLDFYGAPLRVDAEERLERCVTLLDDYARVPV